MRSLSYHIALWLLLAVMLAFAPPVAEAGCTTDWSQAAPLVRKHGLKSMAGVRSSLRGKVKGTWGAASFCQNGGRFTYKLFFLSPTGGNINVTVNARTGRILSISGR